MSANLPLVIEDLAFCYRRRETLAIQQVNLQLEPGQVMLIAGASGCGKTTLMRCINGLIPHTYGGEMSGAIRLFGRPVQEMSMAEISQTVGTVLQDPERQILGSYVLNEVAFGLESLGLPRSEILERVETALEMLGIARLRERDTFGLSGGEKQKIALAGVLAMAPRILLLDEPLASLDPASAHEALQLFRKLADQGIAVMIVEHRVEDVLAIHPEAVVYMEDGRITYHGDQAGLMQVVDYRKIKLPAQVVVERVRADGQTLTPSPSPEGRGEIRDNIAKRSGEQPRRVLSPPSLEGADLVGVAQGQADVVPTIQQAFLAERVHLEAERFAARHGHGLRGQIHHQPITRRGLDLAEQAIHHFGTEANRQQTRFEAVGEKDIGEARRDHATDAVLVQRPDRVLARGTATEILPRQQDGRAPVARLVQAEFRP
jgi:energy-coupling factor transporter ATP-binding protein EcfA2